jgi:hypothetical protein
LYRSSDEYVQNTRDESNEYIYNELICVYDKNDDDDDDDDVYDRDSTGDDVFQIFSVILSNISHNVFVVVFC